MAILNQGDNLLVDFGFGNQAEEPAKPEEIKTASTTCDGCGLTLVDNACANMLCRSSFVALEFVMYFLSALGGSPGGLMRTTLERLVSEGKVGSPADLFMLDELKQIPVIRSAIERAVQAADFTKTYWALGVPMSTAKDGATLHKVYDSLYDVATATIEELQNAGLPSRVAQHCVEYFNQPEAVELLIHLDAAGFPVIYSNVVPQPATAPQPDPQPAQTGSNRVNGRYFVFTGKMEYTRSQMESYCRRLGGVAQDKVNSITDYLVTGARVGKTKTDAARLNGTKVITEQEFYRMAGGRP